MQIYLTMFLLMKVVRHLSRLFGRDCRFLSKLVLYCLEIRKKHHVLYAQ